LLEGNAEALKATQDKYRTFYIDEFQDTNFEQLQIIKLINPARLVVIGDPDQSIYEWNHAKPEYMVNITETFPGIELHKLVDNYRSTTEIIAAANSVIRHNVERIDKDLIAHSSGDCVHVDNFVDETSELENVVKNLDPVYSRNAIICRNNKRAEYAANYLTTHNIPVNLISSSADIFKKGEIKKFMKLMQLIHNPDDDYAFLQVINWPVERISDKELKKIQVESAGTSMPLFTTAFYARNGLVMDFLKRVETLHLKLNKMTIGDTEREIMASFDVIASYAVKNRTTRIVEFEYLRREIQRWRIFQGYMRRPQTLVAFLRYVKLRDIQENIKKDREAVYIMTGHGSKGLEFPNVFVIGLNEREFPSGMSKNMEEERRLFYVAITRAEKQLHLSRSNTKQLQNYTIQSTVSSRFIGETGIDDSQIQM
jgi:superfamily I DNA/RNA helicase